MSPAEIWTRKFFVAVAGICWSVRTQHSFWAHLPITVAVIALAAWLDLSWCRWAALALAITLVWTCELFNTALEELVTVLHPEHDARIGHALDAAAGAVLVTALGAAAVGLIVLGPPLWALLFA